MIETIKTAFKYFKHYICSGDAMLLNEYTHHAYCTRCYKYFDLDDDDKSEEVEDGARQESDTLG